MKTSIVFVFATVGAGVVASPLQTLLETRDVKPSGDGPLAITTDLWFADGALYNVSLPAGAYTDQFMMDMVIWTKGYDDAYTLALVAHEVGNTYPYSIERRLLQPFVDRTPGEPKPVAFVRDNATLSAHQTTYGWRNMERILWFGPDDASPSASGMQWNPTKYPGIGRLYWNETLFDFSMDIHSTSVFAYFISYTLPASKFVDDLPAIFN